MPLATCLRAVGRTVPLRPEHAGQVGGFLAAAGPGPELVEEVSGDTSVDRGGIFQHPLRFQRLRLDVTAEDVPPFGTRRAVAAE
ncbi:hypothetical protein [Streptomyces virginiae]|uniref:hypothetical protein n=1 Tax=Streptomyces virginiae TaxID=1961 RepID=UPI003701F574